MAGLCDGGNEPAGSLKAILKRREEEKEGRKEEAVLRMWRALLPITVIGALSSCVLIEEPSDLFKLRKREESERYCGQDLANAVRVVCNGSFYGPDEPVKRNGDITENKFLQGESTIFDPKKILLPN
ncbi:hypothetical protein ANN_08758 [Periplaneta americana]|uniref:Uncharacterized protein n=1 Tax=Periplaneta americana TaxID=6978 RepID=A0ABQ8T3Y8_PERAM|nr:hypothetical protein ANN_08758 [Periplaneta americana]